MGDRGMQRCLLILLAAFFVLNCAGAEEIAGTWSDGTDLSDLRVLVLNEDGKGSWIKDGVEIPVSYGYGTDRICRLWQDEELLGTLKLSDGFLILTDRSGESWPMMKNQTVLPQRVSVEDPFAYRGRWRADFAIAGGFRLPADELEIVCDIGENIISFTGSNYEKTVDLPCSVSDGNLCVPVGDDVWTFSLLTDGTMIRETAAVIFHYTKAETQEKQVLETSEVDEP